MSVDELKHAMRTSLMRHYVGYITTPNTDDEQARAALGDEMNSIHNKQVTDVPQLVERDNDGPEIISPIRGEQSHDVF
jgi:hypothetical protein